jgi:hypothetical protein
MTNGLLKGAAAEELLRNYFLSLGYYVVRGCKFKYNKFDVTDVDLWLYARNSPLSRERVCVDIKNKRTPQALERIFWVKGLQQVLGVDSCIVATTDTRTDVGDFGLQNNVKVLDGKFLSRLNNSPRSHLTRITEEDLLAEFDNDSVGRLSCDWKSRYESSKSRLLLGLNFDGCNAWLEDIKDVFSDTASGVRQWRLLYALCSHFLTSVDFTLRHLVTDDHAHRRKTIEQGFRYGLSGERFTENVTRMSCALVESVTNQPGLSSTLRSVIKSQASEIKAELLAEYFSKKTGGQELLDTALILEAAAFNPTLVMPSSLPSSCQALFGVLSDFFGIDRKLILI